MAKTLNFFIEKVEKSHGREGKITFVHGYKLDKNGEKVRSRHSVEKVIEAISEKHLLIVTKSGTDEAEVGVYIHSYPDNSKKDNLSSLPPCGSDGVILI